MKLTNKLLSISAAVLCTASFAALAQTPLKATIHLYKIYTHYNEKDYNTKPVKVTEFSSFKLSLAGDTTGAMLNGPSTKSGDQITNKLEIYPFKIATLSDTKFPSGLVFDFNLVSKSDNKMHHFVFALPMNSLNGELSFTDRDVTDQGNDNYHCSVHVYNQPKRPITNKDIWLLNCNYR